jgi:hypothetical protein
LSRLRFCGRVAPVLKGAKPRNVIETTVEAPIAIVAEAIAVVKAAPKKRAKVVKEYPPHEHFGSPLNVCRICGEKYAYVQKPHGFSAGNQ